MTKPQIFYVNPTLPSSRAESFERLISPHLPILQGWVKKRVRNDADADDVIQQTLLLALRHIGQFRFEASLGTWLYRIAMNVIRGQFRKPDYSRLVISEPRAVENFPVPDDRQSPLAAIAKSEVGLSLHRAIARLPESYRTVIKLRDFHGLSIEGTSRSLRISAAAVKSRHRRARLMLLKMLRRDDLSATLQIAYGSRATPLSDRDFSSGTSPV
jgi:RNA polymerase sigma-70 factor, ECF subfamily